jgi:hypothetical protein
VSLPHTWCDFCLDLDRWQAGARRRIHARLDSVLIRVPEPRGDVLVAKAAKDDHVLRLLLAPVLVVPVMKL